MEQTINRGLDGINIDASSISFIDGAKGELIYRGYDIRQLADKASFEEVVFLLWNGELPTATQLDDFNAGLAASFSVPEAVYEMLAAAPRNAAPMHLLRTAVSML